MKKILHTADIHLGVKLTGLGKAGDKVRSALKSTFSGIIDAALAEKVDAVLIAGDLLNSNATSSSLVRFAFGEIERLGSIPCVLLPGTHDCLEEGSVYLSLDESEKPSNLHIFLDPSDPVIRIEEKGLTFYGIPNLAPRSTMNPVASVTRGDFDGKHILLSHGSYMIPDKTALDDHPFGLDDIDNSNFDYVALGHWHSFFELPTTLTKAAYCGSPETLAFDQTGSGHYAIVTLGDKVTVEKRKIGKLEWQEIELSSASFKYTIEVERELQKHINENRLLRVKLTGLASTDGLIRQDDLYDHLADSFLYLKIVDKTETVPDELRKLNLPPTTILGQFIRQVADAIDQTTDENEKELLEESLRTGYAMLSGKDLM